MHAAACLVLPGKQKQISSVINECLQLTLQLTLGLSCALLLHVLGGDLPDMECHVPAILCDSRCLSFFHMTLYSRICVNIRNVDAYVLVSALLWPCLFVA